MTFNLWPSSTVRSTSWGRCCSSANDWKEKVKMSTGLMEFRKSVLASALLYLEGHELVVRLWSPGVDLHRVLQSNHQELNPLIFY